MPYLIDLFLLLLILIFVMIHTKRGLWRTLQSLIVLVLSVALAFAWSYMFAKPVSEKWIAPTISENVSRSIESVDTSAISEQIADTSGDVLKILDRYHVNYQRFADKIAELTDTEQVDLKKAVADGVADAASERIAFIGIFTIMFFLSVIILNLIFRIVGFLDRVPVLHGANHLLGGMLGLLIGIVFAFAATVLIAYFSDTLSAKLPRVFVAGYREKTYIYQYVLSFAENFLK